MKSTTSTLTELARMTGKKAPAMLRQLRRHGVKKTKGGKYNTAAALGAAAAGKQLDKNRLEREAAQAVASGEAESSVAMIGRRANIRRVALQGDILEIERDKARGKLADVAEITERVHKRDAELAMRMNTLRESEIAKHPKHREFIERFCKAAMEKLAEDVEVTG